MQMFLACLLFLNNFQRLLSGQKKQLALPAVPAVTCWRQGHGTGDRVSVAFLGVPGSWGGGANPTLAAPLAPGCHPWKAFRELSLTAEFYVREVPSEPGPTLFLCEDEEEEEEEGGG